MAKSTTVKHSEINIRRYSSILILSIYSSQVATAAIVDNIGIVTGFVSQIHVVYYILTLLAAIPQAGLSDTFGRKRHLLISTSSVLISVLFLLIMILIKTPNLKTSPLLYTFLVALPACGILGLAGNAIPIARGCLATLKVHDFRSSIGMTSVFIGLGWVTVNLLSFIFSPIGVIVFAAILQLIIVLFIKYFYFGPEEKYKSKASTLKVVLGSYKWCVSMLFIAGGAAAIFAYLLSETAFYQIYTLDEMSNLTQAQMTKIIAGKKVIGLLMGFSYLAGVVVQWVMYPTDKKSIQFGVIFSFGALLLYSIYNFLTGFQYIQITDSDVFTKISGLFQLLFAFGFGFSVPALFSLMSKNIHPQHTGRLFGAVDTADTAALAFSAVLFYIRNKLNFSDMFLYIMTLTLFLFSIILYRKFINLFRSYEKSSNKNR